MAIKPLKHGKIKIKLNDDPTTNIVTVELHLDADLTHVISGICADLNKKHPNETAKLVWSRFWVEMICLALQDNVENYVEYALKHKFKGNTRLTSNNVH